MRLPVASPAPRQREGAVQSGARVEQQVVASRQAVLVGRDEQNPRDRRCSVDGLQHAPEHLSGQRIAARLIELAAQPSLATQACVDRDDRPAAHFPAPRRAGRRSAGSAIIMTRIHARDHAATRSTDRPARDGHRAPRGAPGPARSLARLRPGGLDRSDGCATSSRRSSGSTCSSSRRRSYRRPRIASWTWPRWLRRHGRRSWRPLRPRIHGSSRRSSGSRPRCCARDRG